ncbi:MAG: SH3 domain-containing protein [Janthinobacterium lividum]
MSAPMRRAVLLSLLIAVPAVAARKPPPVDVDAVSGVSGLSVPRYVSLKSDKAYLRTGPGDRYPIAWVYVRKGLPVEVIREYGIWRQLRDIDGVVGWMNKSLISGERTAVVVGQVRTLFASADLQAAAVWRIAPGAVVHVVLCDQAWCRIDRGGKSGYILRSQLWGVYPNEQVG